MFFEQQLTDRRLKTNKPRNCFRCVDGRVFSFDAGYGSTHMARIVGQKKAREIWFLCSYYSAKEALDMGLVNTVVPLADLEQVGFNPNPKNVVCI